MTEANSNQLNIFALLDAPFVNFNSSVEPIVWQGQSIVYISPGFSDEVVIESNRVPSDVENITGTYKANRDGLFIMIFDNNFSWFNPKLLTYQIALYQPAFTLADTNRCLQSKRYLYNIIEDTRRAELRLIQCEDRSRGLTGEISQIEDRLAQLIAELDKKKNILFSANEEINEMAKRIHYNLEKKNGLCIRCLDKKVLSLTLSFLGKTSSAYLVCKYWKACIDDFK
eukprot:gene13949-18709_t